MSWTTFDTWIAVTGMLCAISCAIPGCFLVLRKMSMMGDAISHAVLPGLAIAFFATGTRDSLPMFIGAAGVGILTALFTQWISQFGQVDRGAAMGIVFTTLFAIGLILIVRAADHVDLDASCVLYGAIELTPLDMVRLGPFELPRAAAVNGTILLVNLVVVILLFKELLISSFDPGLTDTLGFSPGFMHYLLMTMVAVTTVAAFESVGSIIVIAMLIVPAATALLISRRLVPIIIIACGVGSASAWLGHYLAIRIPPLFGISDTSSSGMMAFAAGILFTLAWIFAPNEGLIARFMRNRGGRDQPARDLTGV
ncbi:metal ABC transporter permease [Coraliomargarita algicola]|uniref:Metal ABC transporter permease n=1 Tax=Coraliomargarita algicola TaxID=3092156 RepID=A0ABZ0RS46_9BACT|nr:metal ABC transporter permease [Coraliomargarita sp. J2-16]WPJ97911.1 metal ABC transporter permease [Coraliomargarita sp. J2-16]